MRMIDFYYKCKPLIPRQVQIALRRRLIRLQSRKVSDIWPIDVRATAGPDHFTGWPEGKKFALVLTHDVDTAKGYKRVRELARIEKSLGFRSAFGFVPEERYTTESGLLDDLKNDGFEVYLHDFNHDGKLFSDYAIFKQRLPAMNGYLKQWDAHGFRAGAMHHNLDWIGELNIDYDMSTFDTDPFEPQPDAFQSIFPVKINSSISSRSYIEIPYTIPQDFTLFALLQNQDIDIWKRKIDWIFKNGAMVLSNTHPDYMCMGNIKPGLYEYPVRLYEDLLNYILNTYSGQFYSLLPGELSSYWDKSVGHIR